MPPAINTILYATDLSECARHAMGYAVAMGRAHDARITVLTVVPDVLEDMSEAAGLDLESHFGEESLSDFRNTALEATRTALHDRVRVTARDLAEQDGQTGTTAPPFAPTEMIVAPGDPAERILQHAGDFDLVVMGTHGRGGLLRGLMGSVAERVLRHSPVPVVVVPLPEPARDQA